MNTLLMKLAEPSTKIGLGQALALTGITTGPDWLQIASTVLSALLSIISIVRKESAP